MPPGILYRRARAKPEVRAAFVEHVEAGGRTNFLAVTNAMERRDHWEAYHERWRWDQARKRDCTGHICQILDEDLPRPRRNYLLALLEIVDLEDVLHVYGRKRQKLL